MAHRITLEASWEGCLTALELLLFTSGIASHPSHLAIRPSMPLDLVQLMSREVNFIATGTGIKVIDVLCFLVHYAQVVCRNQPKVCRVCMQRVS